MVELVREKSTVLADVEVQPGQRWLEFEGRLYEATENPAVWVEHDMISQDEFDAVKELLAGGMHTKLVAARVNVSESTVRNIGRGRMRRPRAARVVAHNYVPTAPYICPGCRKRVKLRPCPFCTIQNGNHATAH